MTAVVGPKWYLKKYDGHWYDSAICIWKYNYGMFFRDNHIIVGKNVWTGRKEPYPYTPCICEQCGNFSKKLIHAYFDFIAWKNRTVQGSIIYEFMCPSCYRKIRRIWKRSIEAQETKSIINKIRKEINDVRRQDEPNQDNGTIASIPS